MKNCVYRFLNKDNEIIYIGKAKDLKQRMNNHTHLPSECYITRNQIEYIEFNSEDDMDFAERYYILKTSPKYNTILANKDMNISSLELDSKLWNIYQDKQVKEDSFKNEISQDTHRNLVKDMEILQAKIEFAIDLMRDDIDNETIRERLDKLRENESYLKNEIIKHFKLRHTPKWIVNMYIKHGVYSNEELIEIKLREIEDEYFEKCLNQIEECGYYKLDIYEEIDLEFICTNGRSNSEYGGHWIHLLDGEFIENSIEKFSVDVEFKNSKVDLIISNIENRINQKFGNLKQEIIMLDSYAEYMKGFYNKYNFMKFKKPFMVNVPA